MTGRVEARLVDDVVEFDHMLAHAQQQRHGEFGQRDIDAAALDGNAHAARGAGCRINVAREGTIFLHDRDARRARQFRRAEGQTFDQTGVCCFEQRVEMFLVLRQRDAGREQARYAVAHGGEPAVEVWLIMREKIRNGIVKRLRCRGIEHGHEHAHERVLFENEMCHAVHLPSRTCFSCSTVSFGAPSRSLMKRSTMAGVTMPPVTRMAESCA